MTLRRRRDESIGDCKGASQFLTLCGHLTPDAGGLFVDLEKGLRKALFHVRCPFLNTSTSSTMGEQLDTLFDLTNRNHTHKQVIAWRFLYE